MLHTNDGLKVSSMPSQILVQDPTWERTEYLLDSTLNACKGADRGGAWFAFASPGGINLLMNNESFRNYLRTSPFDLVVGMDAITNSRAIAQLQQIGRQFEHFSCRAFVGDARQGIFHPKLSWFSSRGRTTALLGSGNLTAGGLRGNHEAFASIEMSRARSAEWSQDWNAWLDRHVAAGELHDLDSGAVRQRAEFNDRQRRARRTEEPVEESTDGTLSVGPMSRADADVLIAEIPRSSGRWQQANFDRDNFISFFGAVPDFTRLVILNEVKLDGSLGVLEERPSIASRSQNYRFELSATRGLDYPDQGRPTA